MIKLGRTILNGTPRIAVAFRDKVRAALIKDAKQLGLDVAELRIDQYASFDSKYVLKEIAKFKGFPTIATIRSKKEGGGWTLSEQDRLRLFQNIMPKVDAVDIELSAQEILSKVVKEAHARKKLVVISSHNFDRTPNLETLDKITKEAKKKGGDIVKIATVALKRSDIQTLANFTVNNASKNLIVIAMGSIGMISRVFFPVLGSLMTYAYIGEPTASGQLDYTTAFDYLRRFYSSFNEEKINSLKLLQNA